MNICYINLTQCTELTSEFLINLQGYEKMIDEKLLEILMCPETKEDLILADAGLVEKINGLIENGSVMNKTKQPVTEKIQGGLIPKDSKNRLYPIRDEIPILLIDESILLKDLL